MEIRILRHPFPPHRERSMTRVIALDVETTGMSPARGDRVIEIGAVVVEGGRLAEEFATLIRTDHPIHWAAQKVHGISDVMLLDAPSPRQVWPEFARFIGNSPLLAHNAPFDLGFLRNEFSRLGLGLSNPHHCTLDLSRRRLPRLSNHRLETVARNLLGEIPEDCRLHRALDDARLAARVWLAMAEGERFKAT